MQWFIDIIVEKVIAAIRGSRFFAKRTGTTTDIASGVWTKVALNTVVFDTKNEWDSVNFRLGPGKAGYYQISFGIGYRPGIPAGEKILAAVKINNDTKCLTSAHTSRNDYVGCATSFLYYAGVGDWIELWTVQYSGSTQQLDYYNEMNYLSIERVP